MASASAVDEMSAPQDTITIAWPPQLRPPFSPAAMATCGSPLDQLVFCVDHEPERGADFRLGDQNPLIDEFCAQRQRD
jgi:hypothetical protein